MTTFSRRGYARAVPLDIEEVTNLAPERFREVLTADGLAQFERTIARGRELLGARTFWTVNSTARGGGVAEMLRSLIGYVRGAGIDARWVVIEGDDEFFHVTKRLHNRLHGYAGDGGPLGRGRARGVRARARRSTPSSCSSSVRAGDIVLLHDPADRRHGAARCVEAGVPAIWRAHIGLDLPNDLAREAWASWSRTSSRPTRYVFSRESYRWEGLDTAQGHA